MTHSAPPSDGALIRRLQAGDEGALEELLALHWSALCRYAEGILGGATDPQDVVQEAFVRLWRRRERWREDGSIRALLYMVTRNAALDELRRSQRRERADQEAAGPPPPPDPSIQAAESDLRRAAERAVAGLPPKRQEVFRLAREDGLSYAEIAEVMGVSPQTVANQMSLALADLRRLLGPLLMDVPPPEP